jgi:hypothetical protein
MLTSQKVIDTIHSDNHRKRANRSESHPFASA